MHANKLKINSDKTHILLITKSGGGEIQGVEVAEKKVAGSLAVEGEEIKQSSSELILGPAVCNTGNWAMVRDDKRWESLHTDTVKKQSKCFKKG